MARFSIVETRNRTSLGPRPWGNKFETRPCAVRLLSAFTIRVRPVDWAALALLAFEVPSLRFSQDPANSVGTSEVVALSVVAYFASRLLLRVPFRAAWLAALVGLGGAWLASVGIHQFADNAGQLAAAGLTDLVSFRSRLLQPIHGWVPGECFTALLLTLPFSPARFLGVYA